MTGARIPVVIAAPPMKTGGTEQHLLYILPALRERGFDVHVVLLAGGGVLEPQLCAEVSSVTRPASLWRRPIRTLQQAWLIRSVVRRTGAKVVHGYLSEPCLAALASTGMQKMLFEDQPTLVHGRRSLSFYSHQRALFSPQAIGTAIERQSHRFVTALVGNSAAVSAELLAESCQPEKVCTIHNGIPTVAPISQEERQASRRIFNIPEDAFVLTYVANFHAYKGHADLLQALSQIADQFSQPWRLVLPGRDGGQELHLRDAVDRMDYRENVIFAGEWPGSRQPYAAADVGLMASHTEGFSNSLIEGMMAGLPMVTTSVGGNLDAIDHDINGLLVSPKAPREMADGILRLARDSALRQQLGAAARKKALRQFSLEACVDRYEKLWRNLAMGAPGTPAAWFFDQNREP